MLQKAVLTTVIYYDALEYPVTEFEAWKHLLTPGGEGDFPSVSLFAVIRSLQELEKIGRIAYKQGFFILLGKEFLVEKRIQQEKEAVQKLKRASRLIRFCSFIPYVRMIAITGSLSMKQGDKQSDWDFLVIMKGGAIWTGRFLLTLWLECIGKRRHGKSIEDKACLNCYLADTHLEVPLRDLFSSHEYRFLYPVVGKNTFRSFELTNRWIGRYRPHFSLTEVAPVFMHPTYRWMDRLQGFLEASIPLRFLEPRLALWQKRMIERNPKTKLAGGFIEATDEALVFLPEPKGPQVFERFKERLSKI